MDDSYYTDPRTGILRNKLGIDNADSLLRAEIKFTGFRLQQLKYQPIDGNFDFDHLKAIHAHVFQDLYEWAGEPRKVDIGKNNIFCLTRNIDSYSQEVFHNFASDCKSQPDAESFARKLAQRYGNLNALHPFREGNGRTQREFARELALSCGYDFNLQHTTHEQMLAASIASFNDDDRPLEDIFVSATSPLPSELDQDFSLGILSQDDMTQDQTDYLAMSTIELAESLSPNDLKTATATVDAALASLSQTDASTEIEEPLYQISEDAIRLREPTKQDESQYN